MKILKALLIFAAAAFVFSACEYEWIEPDLPPIPDEVSFASDVMPVFNNGCNTSVCHGAGGTAPDLSEGAAYNALMNGGFVDTDTPEASIIYTSLKSGSMKSYAKPGDAEIILAWIQQGAKNN